MYRWKITSFIVFSSMFWTVSMASASSTWLLLNWVLTTEPEPKDEIKEEQELIKNEPETEESGSSDEPVKVKKEEPEEQPAWLQRYMAEGDEGGIGSGLESSEAQGLQKRRSHLGDEEYDS